MIPRYLWLVVVLACNSKGSDVAFGKQDGGKMPPRQREYALPGEEAGIFDDSGIASPRNLNHDPEVTLKTLIQTGMIGRQQLIGAGQSATVVKLNGDDNLAENVTVVLIAPQDSELSQADVTLNLSATVRFGVNGIQSQFNVDYVLGYAFTVPASALEVIANNNTGVGLTFGAMVCLKTIASPIPPRRTVQYGTIGAGVQSAGIVIPRYAMNVQIINAGGAAFKGNFIGVGGAQFTVGANQICPKIPIPGIFIQNANPPNELLITNSSAFGDVFYAIYELGI